MPPEPSSVSTVSESAVDSAQIRNLLQQAGQGIRQYSHALAFVVPGMPHYPADNPTRDPIQQAQATLESSRGFSQARVEKCVFEVLDFFSVRCGGGTILGLPGLGSAECLWPIFGGFLPAGKEAVLENIFRQQVTIVVAFVRSEDFTEDLITAFRDRAIGWGTELRQQEIAVWVDGFYTIPCPRPGNSHW